LKRDIGLFGQSRLDKITMRLDDRPTMAALTKRGMHPGIANALKPFDRSRFTRPEPFGGLAGAHPFQFDSVNNSIPQVLRIIFRHPMPASIPASAC
jgi:hypothetical protein